VPEINGQLYIYGALSAIAQLHSQNIIHRDIKLENILVSQTSRGQPTAIVTDYGLATE
jgi:serine/threonine protein kinase